ncbi:uncharacterized protein M6B38_205870 [Iris pallida]|uniref:Uncharacterized protein n=1 Tax=Iris pallida TaxID=29817 RepID=A0AAX6E6L9_IRIPA|nr:uncharacterized protein M6B38_205870 [Iris pallida]
MAEQEIETENMVNGTVGGSKGDNVTTDGSMNNLSDAMKDNSTMPDGNLANNGTAADSALMSNSTRVEDTSQTNSLTNNPTEAESNTANSASISVDQTEGQNNSTLYELPKDVQTSNGTVRLDLARDQNTTVGKGAQGEVESNLENIVEREEKSNSTTVLDSGEQSTTSSATNRNIVNRAGLGETNDMSQEVVEEERETRTYVSTLPSIKNEAT